MDRFVSIGQRNLRRLSVACEFQIDRTLLRSLLVSLILRYFPLSYFQNVYFTFFTDKMERKTQVKVRLDLRNAFACTDIQI